MNTVAMDTHATDPYTPWLGAEDLELLQSFHEPGLPTPPHRAIHHPQHGYHHEFQSPGSSSGDDMYTHTHPYPQSQPATFGGSYVDLMTSPSPPTRAAVPPPIKTTRRSSAPSLSLKSVSARASSPTSPASPTSSTGSNSAAVGHANATGGESRMSAEDERREKNRQKVRRHYYRKLNQLNTLRDEVSQLEAQFQKLAEMKEAEQSGTLVASSPSKRLTQLNETKLALEAENEQLRQLAAQRQTDFLHLRSLLATEHDLFFTSQLAKAIFIKPFTTQECYAESTRAIAGVMALGTPNTKADPFRGPSFLGWQNEVSVVDGFFNFSLFKTFHNVSPHRLSSITWPMVTDPVILRRMYSAAVNNKSVVVQQIDEHNIVLFQEYCALDAHNENVLMKSLFLVTRTQTATGELIVLRGLGQDRLQDRELFLPSPEADAGQIVWHDVFAWYKYDRAGLFGEDCKVSFGGMAPTVGANSQAWSMEVLSLVIRWENAVFGPPQLLPTAASTSSSDNDANASSGSPRAAPAP